MTDIKVLEGLLKAHRPYLVDIEKEISRIIKGTGYGEISCNMTIRHGKVHSWDIGGWIKTLKID